MKRTYVYFLCVVILMAAAIVSAWRTLGAGIAIAALVSLAIGTAISFLRLREYRRGTPMNGLPSRVAALPEKWQKPFLGKEDERRT
jgi:hypothetical protein